jgi:hypothetical protein
MGKKVEAPVKVKVKKSNAPVRADVLKVSKAVKIAATMAEVRGFSKRKYIRIMGEAEENYKNNGRLVFGG